LPAGEATFRAAFAPLLLFAWLPSNGTAGPSTRDGQQCSPGLRRGGSGDTIVLPRRCLRPRIWHDQKTSPSSTGSSLYAAKFRTGPWHDDGKDSCGDHAMIPGHRVWMPDQCTSSVGPMAPGRCDRAVQLLSLIRALYEASVISGPSPDGVEGKAAREERGKVSPVGRCQ
jgi:hypothetical protein